MKRIFFTLTFWVLCFVGFAQVNFHAPDVASINKYIDFPVDKSTGTASIQVPIHTIQAGNFSLPVSLAYHTGGIKVTDMASCVGLGWSLQAGGVISREIKTLPDEGGYYTFHGFNVSLSGPFQPSFIIGDSEPDIFSFSVNGLSGKFFFDKNQQVHLIPEQDISVTMDGPNGYNTFGQFTITADDGTKYIFGDAYDTYDAYDNLSNPRFDPGLVPSAWRLSKIITTSGEEILFTYQSDGYQTRVNTKDPVATSANTGFCASCYTRPIIQQMHANTVTSISSKTCQIIFNYKSSLREDISPDYGNARALDNIEIRDKFFNRMLKKFQLTTSYFQSNDNIAIGAYVGSNQVNPYTVATYLQKRLRLDAVQEISSTNQTLPAHRFYYNKNNPVAKTPNRLSNAQDHWGYYNGVEGNKCLIGYYYSPSQCSNSPYLANRNVNQDYNKAYILDEIIYPTGGYTILKYDKPGGQIPGLRIAEVIQKTGEGTVAVKKKYYYGGVALTGGPPVYAQQYSIVLPGSPDFVVLRYGVQGTYSSSCLREQTGYEEFYIAFNEPANYNGSIASNYAYYGSVVEQQPGTGTIESYYSVQEISDYISDLEYYPLVFSKPALMAGKLSSEIVRNEAGNILKETNYTYNYYYRKIVVDADAARLTTMVCGELLKFYPMYTGFSYLKEKEEKSYLSSTSSAASLTPVVKTTTYDYEGIPVAYRNGQWSSNPANNWGTILHHFQTKETTKLSDGSLMTSTVKYPHDFSSQPVYTDMINRHMIQPAVEESVFKGAAHIKSSKTNFNNWGNGIIAPVTIEKKQADMSYETTMNFGGYDNSGNILSYAKQDDITSAFIYGYFNTMPVVKGENVSQAVLNTKVNEVLIQMGYTNGLGDLDAFLLNLDKLTTPYQKANWKTFNDLLRSKFNLTTATIETYAYVPLVGMAGKVLVDNKPVFYEYDGFNRLSIVRDMNNNIVKSYFYHYLGEATNGIPGNVQGQ